MKNKKNKKDTVVTAAGIILTVGLVGSLLSDWSVISWSGKETGGDRKKCLPLLLAGGIVIKLYMRMRLRNIDGLGEVYKKEEE